MNQSPYNRIFVIVIDSLGVGATPDAGRFDSLGANTLGHISEHFRVRLQLPILKQLGLGNIALSERLLVDHPLAAWGRMQPCSTGISDRESQWEMMGLPTLAELPIFPQGFPSKLVAQLTAKINYPLIANKLMSPRTALLDYGEEQLATGKILLFTNGASTMWLAAHEETIQPAELKRCCQIVRQSLDSSSLKVEKVYGLSFAGTDSYNFYPTDLTCYLMHPNTPTVIDQLQQNGYMVKLIGKTAGLFGKSPKMELLKNDESFARLMAVLASDFTGMCLTELSEFDYAYGRMRNPEGFGTELMNVDRQIGEVIKKLHSNDLLVITANHGNDPAFPGEGHTREYIPLIVYSPSMEKYNDLGIRTTYADLGATILDNYGLSNQIKYGTSFLSEII